jgi:ABC-type phosphate transport system substrate-binding protein
MHRRGAQQSPALLLLALLALLPIGALGVATSLLGAGSSFPEPVMLAQAAAFKLSVPFLQQYAGSNVTYPKGTDGSAFAIPLLAAKSIHFIGTDIALTAAQLATLRAANGNAAVLHIPQVLTGVVMAYHLPGWSTTQPPQPPLNFTADLLARIYQCQVRAGEYISWSDLVPDGCGLLVFRQPAWPSPHPCAVHLVLC